MRVVIVLVIVDSQNNVTIGVMQIPAKTITVVVLVYSLSYI